MFICHLLPIGKPRQTRSDKWKQRPCVIRYRSFADQLRAEAAKQNFTIVNGLHYLFLIPMPISWSDREKAIKNKTWCDQKPDIDNIIKAIFDSLCKEDKAIAWIGSAKKVWSQRPGILISNSPINY